MPAAEATYCVIDIGGTNFRSAVYANGVLIHTIEKCKTPNFTVTTDIERLKTDIEDLIICSYQRASEEYGSRYLAIGFPGPVNSNGEILGSAVIFGKALECNYCLHKAIRKRMKRGVNILVTNDLTASVWRYSQRYRSFCLITVSSGIGNKIFYNGNVLTGETGLAGEIGHYSLDLEDVAVPCSCGWGNNHIGIISSGRGVEIIARQFAADNGKYRSLYLTSALAKATGNAPERITSELIAHYSMLNDPFPRTIIDYCTKPLADAIRLLALALPLDYFILIGGFALHCPYYLESVKKNIYTKGIYNFTESQIEKMIIYGINDDNHTLIGLGKMTEHTILTG